MKLFKTLVVAVFLASFVPLQAAAKVDTKTANTAQQKTVDVSKSMVDHLVDLVAGMHVSADPKQSQTTTNKDASVQTAAMTMASVQPQGYPALAMQTYQASLPKISTHASVPTAQRITEFLCKFSMGAISKGQDQVYGKIQKFIDSKSPVKLLLLGFSYKSKSVVSVVLDDTLDFAEYVGLFTLDYMCQQIESIHPPGAQVHLYTREMHMDDMSKVFEDTFGSDLYSEDKRIKYQQDLQHLITHRFNHHIKLCTIQNLDDLYEREKQQLIASEISFPKEAVEGTQTFFMCNELKDPIDALGLATTSNAIRKKLALEIANVYLLGVGATRRALELAVPDYASFIRLSIRAGEDGNISKKLGIALVQGSKGTPWVNVLVAQDSGVSLMAKKKAPKGLSLAICQMNGLPLAYLDATKKK